MVSERKQDFSSQTVPLEDPLEGSEDGEPQAETLGKGQRWQAL